MKSLQFSSMKSKGNILSLSILVLLFITLFGCQPNNGKSGGDGDQKSGGESGVKVVIRTGEEALGAPGTQFHMLTSLALNNSGQVAFKAALVGGGVTNDNDEGIWVGDSESLVLVAREGTNAPGLSGNHFGDTMFPTEAPLLNDDGQIAFKARFSPGGPIGLASQGIWVGTAESLSLVTRSGASAPGAESSSFRLFDDLRLNGVGQVAFKATLMGLYITDEIDEGIWSGSPGNLSMVKRKAPATIVSTDRPAFDGLSINDDGRVMLRAQFPPTVTQITEPSGASGVQVRYNYGLFMRPPVIGSDLVVRPGDNAHGVYVFEYLNEPGFNATSNYAFAASTSATNDNENSGIWIHRQGTRYRVAVENTRPQGTAAGVVYGDLAGIKVALNNQDEIAFRAGLRGTGVTDANNMGIWAGTGGDLSLVAREGGSAVGSPGTTFSFLGGHLLNNAGDVAFGAILEGSGVVSSNDSGIWATRQGNLSIVAREGDSYEVAPGLIRTVIEFKSGLAFNDSGQVAFLARFSDDTIGLVVVTP
jgi:hypothetical protein